MISAIISGESVGGACIELYRFDIDGEEVGFSTSVPLPVQRAGGGRGKGCTGVQVHSAHTLHWFGNEKQGSFSRNSVGTAL